MTKALSLDFATLRRHYSDGSLSPTDLVENLLERTQADPHHAWIAKSTSATLHAFARELEGVDPESLPLYGIPFAIKDNIDLAGVPTTAGCPAFAYTPKRSATVVQRLIDAGAIPIGKTNLDQFATGLSGTRSPYGPCRNAFDPEYVSGGSSSGSAVATALGQVSFALGTDTAGSGRVPAAFNNLVGLKPTLGHLSSAGIVPACRTLDTASVFALTARDAADVLRVAGGYDKNDPYSHRPVISGNCCPTRFKFGLPARAQTEFFGNAEYEALFAASIARLIALGGLPVEIDFEPFLAAARLLYEGPWLAERTAAVGHFIEQHPDAVHPVTRTIIERGRNYRAIDTFEAMYRLAALRREIEPVLLSVDAVVTPTTGTIYRLDEMLADPVALNANLGYFTNFMNLLDLAAVAVPAGFTAAGLPFGITVFGDAWSDPMLLDLAARFQRDAGWPLGATGAPLPPEEPAPTLPAGHVAVAVCGAHMDGLPLNRQLIERGAFLLQSTHTSRHYRFYALPGGPPFRPGLVRVEQGGAAIEVEVWAVPLPAYGSFVAGIPRPLGIGTVELHDGAHVQGFVCEPYALARARDITDLGGWRAYLATLAV